MIGEVLKLAWWLFFVIFKFIWAPLTMATTTDYIWWEILLVTIIGGWLGIFIFYYFGKIIMEWINKRRKNPPKRFSQLNRFVVRVKRNYGLTGLVTIMGVISVPVCTLIAAAYFKENKRVIPALMASVVIWSCSLTAIVYLFIDI